MSNLNAGDAWRWAKANWKTSLAIFAGVIALLVILKGTHQRRYRGYELLENEEEDDLLGRGDDTMVYTHSGVTAKTANRLLLSAGITGAFLVRSSKKQAVLSVLHHGQPRHFPIKRDLRTNRVSIRGGTGKSYLNIAAMVHDLALGPAGEWLVLGGGIH